MVVSCLTWGGIRNVRKEVKGMELTIYEQNFKNQPLYSNKFNLSKEEKEQYLQMVPAWVKEWQKELDNMYEVDKYAA